MNTIPDKIFETITRGELMDIVNNRMYENIFIKNYDDLQAINLTIYKDGEIRVEFNFPYKLRNGKTAWDTNFICYMPNKTKEECIKLGSIYEMNVCTIDEFYHDF